MTVSTPPKVACKVDCAEPLAPEPQMRTSKSGFRQARTDHLCFGSSASRFALEKPKQAPDAMSYDVISASSKLAKHFGGPAKSTTKRNLENKRMAPSEMGVGPGQYETVGDLADKTTRTFNTSVERAHLEMQRLHEAARNSGWRPAVSDTKAIAIAA